MFRFLTLILTLAQLLSISTVTVSANSNEKSAEQTETTLPPEGISLSNDLPTESPISVPERELKPIISSEKFSSDEQIKLGFDHTDLADYYYIADGITVTEDSSNSMQFSLTATEEFGSMDVYADYGNGEVVKSSVYTCKYGDTVYVSDIAKDQAWHTCMNEQYKAGLITLEEWEEAYFTLSRTFVEETVEESDSLEMSNASLTATTSNTNTVTGTLSWAYNENNDLLPLKLTKVELHDKDTVGSRCIATTYTDENGILLDSDDDSGYGTNALLSYNVTAGVKYMVKVKFYRSSQSGDVKLAITPTTAYATYESTLSCTTNASGSMRTLSLNNVDLLRYTVPSAMTVTFTMDATYDTYLYVIDPRSTLPISSSASQPSTYNDDGAGNLQAKITKTLDANVPYLVIVSAYNPATQSGVYRLNFGY